ncbi:hypothetical protein [Microcoleus sp. AT3-D2]|uniref:hypothetical protein n=1 Tax=Microcoleus sp. AT3-D2 TaxID=2818612 RepID=UPI002FD572FA
MIVDSFIPLGRSYTGYNFLSADRLCRRAILCNRIIIDSLTRKGDRLCRRRSNCAIDSGGDQTFVGAFDRALDPGGDSRILSFLCHILQGISARTPAWRAMTRH